MTAKILLVVVEELCEVYQAQLHLRNTSHNEIVNPPPFPLMILVIFFKILTNRNAYTYTHIYQVLGLTKQHWTPLEYTLTI